jgi:hypothetical protein
VKKLKEKIEEEKGKETFPAAGQKLIYAGMFIFLLMVCEVEIFTLFNMLNIMITIYI